MFSELNLLSRKDTVWRTPPNLVNRVIGVLVFFLFLHILYAFSVRIREVVLVSIVSHIGRDLRVFQGTVKSFAVYVVGSVTDGVLRDHPQCLKERSTAVNALSQP